LAYCNAKQDAREEMQLSAVPGFIGISGMSPPRHPFSVQARQPLEVLTQHAKE
jgi:hypothetical protein